MPTGYRRGVVHGVCPVLETPFTDDGRVDEAGFTSVIDHVLAVGVSSVMFPGFASEFHKLTDDERQRFVRVLLERTQSHPQVTAVVSIPDHSTEVAITRARDAVAAGAQALNLLPPHFLGPTPAAVRHHIEAVLAAVAPVPVILQYAPAQTGTALDATIIGQIATIRPNLVQVKVESAPPGKLISALGGTTQTPLSAIVGYAGVQLPDALHRGAVAVQPGCSFVELYQKVWQAWESGRRASALHLHGRMLPYLSYWMQNVELMIAAEKEISYRRGLIGSAFCRGPAYSLDDDELTMIGRFLQEFADLLPMAIP